MSRRWALSAAHCFTEPSGAIERLCRGSFCRDYAPSDFDIVAGLYDVESESNQVNFDQNIRFLIFNKKQSRTVVNSKMTNKTSRVYGFNCIFFIS